MEKKTTTPNAKIEQEKYNEQYATLEKIITVGQQSGLSPEAFIDTLSSAAAVAIVSYCNSTQASLLHLGTFFKRLTEKMVIFATDDEKEEDNETEG